MIFIKTANSVEAKPINSNFKDYLPTKLLFYRYHVIQKMYQKNFSRKILTT